MSFCCLFLPLSILMMPTQLELSGHTANGLEVKEYGYKHRYRTGISNLSCMTCNFIKVYK